LTRYIQGTRDRWGRRAIAATVAVTFLIAVGTASASFSAPPQPLAPAQGATTTADSPLTFTVQAPQAQSVYLSVSSSAATDSSGRIGVDGEFAGMAPGADPTSYSYTPPSYTFPGWFLHTPGTYYWQASYFACDNTTFQCAYQNSPVMTLNVVAPPPTATTLPPTSPTAHTARLNGTIDTNGVSGTFYFDFGSTTAYGSRSGTGQVSASDQGTPVYVDFTGLSPDSEYHYRIVVTTAAGTAVSPDQMFYTAPLDHWDRIPAWIGRQGSGAGFHLNVTSVPAYVNPTRFRNVLDRSAARWGLRDLGTTYATPALTPDEIDGVPEVAFSSALPAETLGEDIIWYDRVRVGRRRVCRGRGRYRRCHRTPGHLVRRVVDRDVALNARVPWNAGPWYPDGSQFDLESTVLHELGHFAGNPRHQPRCTDSPMVEALGPGEFWRAPNEWFEFGCRASDARGRVPSGSSAPNFAGGSPRRFVTIARTVPPGWTTRRGHPR
jgi:hypothetical protein